MTLPDHAKLPALPKIGDVIGCWTVTELVASGKGCFVTCRNCDKDQIFNLRECFNYRDAVCFYTRCSAFSLHFENQASLEKWKSDPSHLKRSPL